MHSSIQQHATNLVENDGVAWHEAEKTALSKIGITDADIEELRGTCFRSTVLTGDDITALIRSVLVHGAELLIRNPTAITEGYQLTPVEPTDEMYGAGYDVLREIHAGPFNGSPSLGHAGQVFKAMLKVAPMRPVSLE